MLLTLNLKDRKPLVKAVSEFVGEDAIYMRVPTYAYKIGNYTVTKEGNLEVPNNLLPDDLHNLYEMLSGKGFGPLVFENNSTLTDECGASDMDGNSEIAEDNGSSMDENSEIVEDDTAEVQSEDSLEPDSQSAVAPPGLPLTISLPMDKVNLDNLNALLASKGALIKKALGIDNLPVETNEEEKTVSFPWFTSIGDADTIKAYSHFIAAICEMSVTQKRISSKEKAVENEKYEFRGLLLRLGFIGEEFKAERKILLKNLSGNSAWSNGVPAK